MTHNPAQYTYYSFSFGKIFSLRASKSISLNFVVVVGLVLVLLVVVSVVILCKNVSIRINKYLYMAQR